MTFMYIPGFGEGLWLSSMAFSKNFFLSLTEAFTRLPLCGGDAYIK